MLVYNTRIVFQSSVAARLRCGRNVINTFIVNCLQCASGRISKISQYLAKIWTKVCWHIFNGPRSMMYNMSRNVSGCKLVKFEQILTQFDLKQQTILQSYMAINIARLTLGM